MTKGLLVAALIAGAPLAALAGTYSFVNTSSSLENMAHGTAYTWGLSGSQYTSLLSAVQSGQQVTGATLTISNIYDWTVESKDVLYVNILSGLNAGVSSGVWDSAPAQNDTAYGPDAFVYNSSSTSANAKVKANGLTFDSAATNSLLTYTGSYNTAGNPGTWSDPYGAGSTNSNFNPGFDLVVNFTATNLSVLRGFLAADTNGTAPNVGLGFAPDCHYFDSGVTLTITTASGQNVPDAGSTLAMMTATLAGLALVRRRFLRA